MAKHIVAVVFDFDDTLVPDSTTALLESRGVNATQFWQTSRKLIDDGYDPVHAYLKLLLDNTKSGMPLEGLTNASLGEFGATLKPYKGLPAFFGRLRKLVAEEMKESDIEVKFWVISGGLEEIIRGCTCISNELTGFWGCRLGSSAVAGPVEHIKRAISFTEKTRYLFEIHKGLSQSLTDRNPLLVNRNVPEAQRKVPFENMIYVGDGLTDVPCFSLVQKNRGAAFGILHKDDKGNAKREVFEQLIGDRRVASIHSPEFTAKADLAVVLKSAVANICTRITVRESQALG